MAGSVYWIDDNQQTAAPRFTPGPGTNAHDEILLHSISPGATIRYTTDGSDPIPTSPLASSITITNGTLLKARAFRDDLLPSEVSAGSFFLRAAAPHFNPPQGPIKGGAAVSILTDTPGATIRYSTDGTEPTSTSVPYTEPLVISPETVLRARAFRDGFDSSAVAEFAHVPLRLGAPTIFDFLGDNYFCWESKVGKTYQIEFSYDLGAWFALGRIIDGTGGSLCYTNWQMLPAGRSRFLRVNAFQK